MEWLQCASSALLIAQPSHDQLRIHLNFKWQSFRFSPALVYRALVALFVAEEFGMHVQDELLWAALWLYDATNEEQYLRYVVENAEVLGGLGWSLDLFSWDNKYVGVQLKATKVGLA